MSEKATCPSCDAHLSSIYRAFREGAPCPNCGLPAEVAAQVDAIRTRYLDDDRTEQLEDAIAARGKAEAQRDDYRRELVALHAELQRLLGKVDQAIRPLDEKTRERGAW